MKKVYFLFFSFFFLVGFVKADTNFNVNYKVDDLISPFPDMSYTSIRSYFDNKSEIINTMVSHFMSDYDDYYSTYPYYVISFSTNDTGDQVSLTFYAFSSLPIVDFTSATSHLSYDYRSSCSYYNNDYHDCYTISTTGGQQGISYGSSTSAIFNAYIYFFSNFYLYDTGVTQENIAYHSSGFNGVKDFLYSSSSPIPTMYDFFELTILNDYVNDTYTEVNLNDYEYIIISYKDYSNLISPTIFEVKGQFCPTIAYDYGQTPKQSVTDICSVVYTSFTPTRLYVTESDLQRGAVFYLKAYDTSIENKVKINTSVYNIAYFTSTTADEPTIYVGGRPYSATPYDSLPSTATANTSSGYVPGASCGIGDIDCVYETGGVDFSDLFSHPLVLLQSVWGSITNMFVLIAAFISLLPITLQVFLYSAFMLAILLGLLKIIL